LVQKASVLKESSISIRKFVFYSLFVNFVDLVLKKTYKILGLSILILILSLVFFFWRGKEITKNLETKNNQGQFRVQPLSQGFVEINSDRWQTDIHNQINLPSPDKFNTFSYPQTKSLKTKTLCADTYLTVLIFNLKDDYRQNPGAAKFNSAFPCRKGEEFIKIIDLEKINLSQGKYYYIIADQGSTGSWYNPR